MISRSRARIRPEAKSLDYAECRLAAWRRRRCCRVLRRLGGRRIVLLRSGLVSVDVEGHSVAVFARVDRRNLTHRDDEIPRHAAESGSKLDHVITHFEAIRR